MSFFRAAKKKKKELEKKEKELEKATLAAEESLASTGRSLDGSNAWSLVVDEELVDEEHVEEENVDEEHVEPPTIEEKSAAPTIEEKSAAPTIEEKPAAPTIEEKPAAPTIEEKPAAPAAPKNPKVVFVSSFDKLRRDPNTPSPDVPKIVRPYGAGSPYLKIRKYESSHAAFPAPSVSAYYEGATIRRMPNGPPGPPKGVEGQYRYVKVRRMRTTMPEGARLQVKAYPSGLKITRQPTNELAGSLREYGTLAAAAAAVGWGGHRGYATQAEQLKKSDVGAAFLPPVIPNPALLEPEPSKEPPPIRVPFLPDNVFSRYHRKEFVPEVKPPFKPSISSADSDVSKISPTSALSKVAGGEEEQGKFGWSEWLDEWLFASMKGQQNKEPVLAPRDDDPGPEMTEEKKAALKALAVAAAVWWFFGP
jgi:hypothetical protein